MKKFIHCPLLLATCFLGACGGGTAGEPGSDNPATSLYPIVDTNQQGCYSAQAESACPASGESFFGQDTQYKGQQPSYRDNGDGTVSDLVTGLMWAQAQGSKVAWEDAALGAASFELAGHDDWRLPTIKELYSLTDFQGGFHTTADDSRPYINIDYFGFAYGDESTGERLIDTQYCSATEYVGTTMSGDHTVFGVNFADGRIKGYGTQQPNGTIKKFVAKYVRGNPNYGVNDFVGNDDGTVTDRATGLMWQQADSGSIFNWQEALAYAEALNLAGYDDWRLPNAKELQSIVDYSRAPAVTGSAAIDPSFSVTEIESYYWTSTTHLDGPIAKIGQSAVYVAFGRAMGFMEMPPGSGNTQFIDVHGAGAQRSDPKEGDPADYPTGHGPQGDDIRIFNYVRCVRGVDPN